MVVVGPGVVPRVVVGPGVVPRVVVGPGVVPAVVVAPGVVPGFVVGGGEAWAWAGATMELIRGFDHVNGRTRLVATPPMMTFKTCLRS
jgi:hypothetical protein